MEFVVAAIVALTMGIIAILLFEWIVNPHIEIRFAPADRSYSPEVR